MRRTKEDSEETRKVILNAAKQVFGRKEYSATTLEEIAETANLTRGAVYWHFKNKEDLIHNLLDEYEEYLADFAKDYFQKKAEETMSLSEKGHVWISVWIQTILSERSLFRIRALHSIQYNEKISLRRKEANSRLMQSVKDFFEPNLTEIRNPLKEIAFNFVVMTIDTSIATKVILEGMKDYLLKDISPELLIREYHQIFISYLGLNKINKKEGVSNV